MQIKTASAVALLMAVAACGGGEGGNGSANEVATGTTGGGDALTQVRALPEGQRNGVFIRAIRDANLACQQVTGSTEKQGPEGRPYFETRCQDGGVYAVSIADDGTAFVQPMTAQGK